jgi:hypothetical protein
MPDKELLKSYKIALLAYDRALSYACMDWGCNSDPVLVDRLKKDYVDIATYDLAIEGNPEFNKE